MLEKFGVYDFFGVLLPGMAFTIFLIYMDCPIVKFGGQFEQESLRVVVFVVISYIVGVITQEIGSFFDEKVPRLKEKACTKFLEQSNEENAMNKLLVWFKDDKGFCDEELDEIKRMICQMTNTDTPCEKDCRTAFFKCKAYLENHNMAKKSEQLNAAFAMSRDMIASNALIALSLVCTIVTRDVRKLVGIDWAIITYVLISSLLFARRAYRFSRMRVRTVLRQYKVVAYSENREK